MNTLAQRSRETLNPLRPYSFCLERERSESGEIVPTATVFLTNRECPWRCVYCDLWKNTLSETVPPGAIPTQIDYALKSLHPVPGPELPRQIKLYNAGSFFDPLAIPPVDFPAIAKRVGAFERVIVECHPALVGPSAVQFRDLLAGAGNGLPAPILEVAMGLEIADDRILNRLNKRMTLRMFGQAAEFLQRNGMALRVFVMVRPPFVRSDDEALRWAERSMDFAFDCGATVISLIPTRAETPEMEALARAGDFSPPALSTLRRALEYGIGLGRGRVFADLWDLEKLGSCPICGTSVHRRFEELNFTQARNAPDSERCVQCGEALVRANM